MYRFQNSPTLLLVEDNPPDAKAVTRAAERLKLPLKIVHVPDGLEALRFLRREAPYETAPRPDLVFLDLNLPRVPGHEVLAETKRDPSLSSIPIVVLSGSEAESDVRRCYELGANSYLVKPGSLEKLNTILTTTYDYWFVLGRTPERCFAP